MTTLASVPISPHDTETTPFRDMLQVPNEALLKSGHDQVRKNILNCQSCPSSQLTKPLSLHTGVNSRIMIVGDRPEDVLLDSSSGKYLSELLKKSQLDMKELYFTAAVKCVEATDSSKCHHHLTAELLTLRPMLVIALGYQASLSFAAHPSVGAYVPMFSSITLLATYSVSDAMKDSSGQIYNILLGQFTYISNQLRGMMSA